MDRESCLLVKASLERRSYTTEQKHYSIRSETDKFQWTSCKDFTIEMGKEQINNYIQTWKIRPCWLYSLDFLYSTKEEHCIFYHYRARFSTPTLREPITGRASVYFAVEVNKDRPQTLPVEVHFIVESNRLVHTAEDSRFREEWLSDVIESKAFLRKMVNL